MKSFLRSYFYPVLAYITACLVAGAFASFCNLFLMPLTKPDTFSLWRGYTLLFALVAGLAGAIPSLWAVQYARRHKVARGKADVIFGATLGGILCALVMIIFWNEPIGRNMSYLAVYITAGAIAGGVYCFVVKRITM